MIGSTVTDCEVSTSCYETPCKHVDTV